MKTRLSIILVGIIGISAAGCSSTKIKHLNSEEFVKQAAYSDHNSAFTVTYIGSAHNRVYLQKSTFSLLPWRDSLTIVYWTELENLPLDVTEKIKSKSPPWRPFDHRLYEKQRSRQTEINTEELYAEPVD